MCQCTLTESAPRSSPHRMRNRSGDRHPVRLLTRGEPFPRKGVADGHRSTGGGRARAPHAGKGPRELRPVCLVRDASDRLARRRARSLERRSQKGKRWRLRTQLGGAHDAIRTRLDVTHHGSHRKPRYPAKGGRRGSGVVGLAVATEVGCTRNAHDASGQGHRPAIRSASRFPSSTSRSAAFALI
jgi:hypothetical protein